jgi:hypothetical protein
MNPAILFGIGTEIRIKVKTIPSPMVVYSKRNRCFFTEYYNKYLTKFTDILIFGVILPVNLT